LNTSVLTFLVSLQGGLSSGYKKFIAENGTNDDTYSEDGIALFRIQGSGPENMQAIQVDSVSSVTFMFMNLSYNRDVITYDVPCQLT
jgi:hypothetical protein